ncbi:uncharacterized protein [Littorina saxatilis]|uniref:Uncharacterized protein n=1 Tax=Littorina saxatilis TaxID=31220 RepID=A0AAN9G9F1_9CAEN
MSREYDQYRYKKAYQDVLDRFRQRWFCKKCDRYCPNCAGRSCLMCCVHSLEATQYPADQTLWGGELRPTPIGITHQDSLFRNSFQAKPYHVVHPEWISESVKDPTPKPLDRPPWPWEQPRYRVNMQIPITYESPVQKKEGEEEEKKEEEYDYAMEVPPLSYHLTNAYRSVHPAYVERY